MEDEREGGPVPRARPRRKLFQPCELDVAGASRRVHLLDLSETGAQVNGTSPPAAGSLVTLDCSGWRRSARVAWVRGQRFGVTFVAPLTPTQLEELLAIGARGPRG